MGQNFYIGDNSNLSRSISSVYIGVNNIARPVVSGYIGVNGIARQFYSGLTPYAMLYTDGNFVFQLNKTADSSKTLINSYKDYENIIYNYYDEVPWQKDIGQIKQVSTASGMKRRTVPFMSYWFYNARNLTNIDIYNGFDVDKILNMYRTYSNCRNLIGSPVCGNNVTDMYCTYCYCFNLTGSPVCGNNVTDMRLTYCNCYNLTGSPVCGNNVTDMGSTYYYCRNLNACTVNWYSPNIANITGCFYGKNNSRRYNIHIVNNSTTFNTIINTTNTRSIVGAYITWSQGSNYYYNSTYNIYIYPDL